MHPFCDMYSPFFSALLCPHLSCKAHKSQAGHEHHRRQSSKTKSKLACKQLYIYLKGGEGETVQQSWMMKVKIWPVGVWKVKILK